jgi:hypothetical protein
MMCTWCDIEVTWSGIAAPGSGDRIALVTAGSPPNSPWHNWRFLTGAASGTVNFNIPGSTPFGSYQVRLYSPNGQTLIATSAPFQATPAIAGYITSGGAALGGVTVSGTNGAFCWPNDPATGWYACIIPYGWSGTLTPSKPGYLFSPASQSYTNVTNHIHHHYTTNASAHAVSGTIAVGGSPLANVAIAGTNGASCTTTNASGQYTCAVLPGWSGSVTPSLANHTFTPTSRSYTNVTSAQPSQGYAAEHFPIVSGTTTVNGSPLAGVTLTATNGVTCTTSNASGQYSCIAPPGWSGSVTPTLGAYAFAPASRSYTSIATHQSAQDYATGIFQLSGTVTVNSQPLGGVSVSATNGTTCTATNASRPVHLHRARGLDGNHHAGAERLHAHAGLTQLHERPGECGGGGLLGGGEYGRNEGFFHPPGSPQHATFGCRRNRYNGVALGSAGAVRGQRAG